MKIRRRGKAQAGFSLVEAIVAIAILLVGFLGITGLVLGSIRNNNYTRNLAMADHLSTNLMEFWQSATYQKIDVFLAGGDGTTNTFVTTDTPTFDDAQLNNALTTWQSQIQANLPGGRGVVTVTANTDIASISAADIEVRVEWLQKHHVYSCKKTLYRNNI